MPAVLLAELMNEYEALRANEHLLASSTHEAFGWVGYRTDSQARRATVVPLLSGYVKTEKKTS